MIAFLVNGRRVSLDADGSEPLLEILRNRLGLRGTRFGCGAEQCGACTVLVDNQPAYSCSLMLDAVAGRAVRTVEGIADGARLHPIQQAILDEQAGQCGYCLSGIVMSMVALLEHEPHPDRRAILTALDRHLCRCGSHRRIMRAVEKAAEKESGRDHGR